ncbi:uncharacterized protein LOC142235555 [Haematobia irritans]|uniref:uncharacterized protein LOC142235555 n=1 Tax=Haematobia irritans TaxID=7368 RepID=UPI003F4F5881
MSDSEEQNSILKRKCLVLKYRLETIEIDLKSKPIDGLDEADISVRLQQVNKLNANFEKLHNLLEDESPNEIDSNLPVEFETLYISAKSILTRKSIAIKMKEDGSRQAASNNSTFNETHPSFLLPTQKPRLPILQNPKFAGDYSEWPDFYSMFRTVIGEDNDLTKIEKFQHLRSCLTGSALDTIRSLEIIEENYDKAIDLLIKRFDNKRLNFQAHIRDIFGLSSVEDGSVAKLRHLSDSINSHLRALLTMGSKEQIADCMLIHLVGRKLDAATRSKWEESTPNNDIPKWDNMAEFLQQWCQRLENVEYAMVTKTPSQKVGNKHSFTNNRKRSFVVTNDNSKVCNNCKSEDHNIYNCPEFLSLTPSQRFQIAKKFNLCLNCLRKGHGLKSCKSSSCRHCTQKHNTLLHMDSKDPFSNNSNSENIPSTSNGLSSTNPYVDRNIASASNQLPYSVLVASSTNEPENYDKVQNAFLATAIVFVKGKSGFRFPCRAILDSASQANFITTNCLNRLQLKADFSTTVVSGIGQTDFSSMKSVQFCIESHFDSSTAYISAAVISTIIDKQPPASIDISSWNIPPNLKLADPKFNESGRIDLLIGSEIFFESLCDGKISMAPGLPVLVKSKFGWIVGGGGNQFVRRSMCLVGIKETPDPAFDIKLHDLIRSFWEIENNLELVKKVPKEDIECEQHFVENYTRLESGEYSVRLPFKSSPKLLGNSYEQALRRFKNLEKRLHSAFIKEYCELNHMSLITSTPKDVPVYFLPHHCVVKEESTTTKLRVVFDGSSRTTSGLSLNDVLMCGPNIQPLLFDILIRFRSFYIALTGDICKMYRCVRMASPDNYLQCILWRDNSNEPIKIFRLDTVTYGTKSASFLAIRSMQQLACDERKNYPIGSKIVFRDFYVDDLISGGSTIEEVNEIKEQTTNLLRRGNFVIRKWCSNDPHIMRNIPENNKEKLLTFSDCNNVTKTLGLVWSPESDSFLFSHIPVYSQRNTKRSVMSTIARIYDPLGLIGPVVTKVKVFLQLLWKEKIEWDEILPHKLNIEWGHIYDELKHINNCSFPRRVLTPKSKTEVHAFCDASRIAYGALAPTKVLTIPKLELAAASLLAELIHKIKNLDIFIGDYYCWSDSSIVLSWIREDSSDFHVFVSNRVSRIQTLTSSMTWNYVPTDQNPADILSRGSYPLEISKSTLWLFGPNFLRQNKSMWPNLPDRLMDLPEKRKVVMFATHKTVDFSSNCKFITSYGKLCRVYAYVYKFGAKKIGNRKGPLTVQDVRLGTMMLIRMVQRSNFFKEYQALSNKTTVDNSSPLISLNPFLDDHGVLRVGGRLNNSNMSFNAKHPTILPKRHPLSESIINYFHHEYMHAGPSSLLANIRLEFWPIGGRKEVSRIVNKCVRCYRVKPQIIQHIMGNLPAARVCENRAFLICGVDYCGPLYYRSEIRSRPAVKCYISLFVCFITKAVHLELVKDLSTQAFLAALKRFISTRGKPSVIWSDNATNFVGAKNELLELKRLFLSEKHITAVHESCLQDTIDWKCIPPRSPHFGGLWEASVKIAKTHILKTIGLSILDFDELRTIICQISAIMNSRPLCSISENPDDLEVITPAHFLVGSSLVSVIEPDITTLNINHLNRWQRVCYMQQHFWRKWSTEYLTSLQQRTKWQRASPNLQPNDMVLLKDENLPPLKWSMGRVVEVIAGEDDVVRVAVIRTTKGITRRAVSKLCRLPTNDVERLHLPKGEDVLRPVNMINKIISKMTLCACNHRSGPFVPATTDQDPLCLQPPIRTLCACNHTSGPSVPATTHQDPSCLQPLIRTLCACNRSSGPFVPATTHQDPLCLQPPIRTLCACNHSSGPFVPATTHQDPLCLQYPLCL